MHDSLIYVYNGPSLLNYIYIALCLFLVISLSLSLGLYQWSDKVIKRATRLWDIRGGHMVRHTVHLLATPRVVVSISFLFKETLSK